VNRTYGQSVRKNPDREKSDAGRRNATRRPTTTRASAARARRSRGRSARRADSISSRLMDVERAVWVVLRRAMAFDDDSDDESTPRTRADFDETTAAKGRRGEGAARGSPSTTTTMCCDAPTPSGSMMTETIAKRMITLAREATRRDDETAKTKTKTKTKTKRGKKDDSDEDAMNQKIWTRVKDTVRSAREAVREAKRARATRCAADVTARMEIDALTLRAWGAIEEIVESLIEKRVGATRSRGSKKRAEGIRLAVRDGWFGDDDEVDVAEKYNASERACERLGDGAHGGIIRLLDDFELVQCETTSASCDTRARRRCIKFHEDLFENPDVAATIRISGRLREVRSDALAPLGDDDKEDGGRQIEVGNIVAYQYSFVATVPEIRGFYLVTSTATYKLLKPKATYSMLYNRSFQMRYDLARRTARALPRSPRSSLESIIPELLTRQPADVAALRMVNDRDAEGETWTDYKIADVWACKTTLCNLCMNELDHLNRRSAQMISALMKKTHTMYDMIRETRDEFVMSHQANVVDVLDEDLERIFGEGGWKSCADARPILSDARDEDTLATWIEEVKEKYNTKSCIVEEALQVWEFCAEHADVLRLPLFSFHRFMRAVMCPVSKASWTLLRDVHCALIGQVTPSISVIEQIVVEGRRADPTAAPTRVARFETELHVHAWPEIARELIDDEGNVMDVKLAASRASSLLAKADYFQLTPRMRLATMSALVALTLKQREFHRFLSDRRGEDEEGKPPRDNRDEKSMIDNLERKCVLFDGYAHLTEEAVKDHPTIAQTRAEILHFLQISSHRWRRLDWLATHIVGLMKQCHTSSFVELRMVLWNFEVAVYNLQLLDAKKWDGCRQLWRSKVCASKTAGQLAQFAYTLLSNLPSM